jgi:DNA modification methylase
MEPIGGDVRVSDSIITYRNPNELRPSPRNSRKHTTTQISRIALSIATYGFVEPAIITRDDEIVVGHARIAAALKLGLDTIPTICAEGMSAAQVRAYRIASNRLAELSDWDEELLALELSELEVLECGFDLTTTGWDNADIDRLTGLYSLEQDDEESPMPPTRPEAAVSKSGDHWQLGVHSLLCADATKPESYSTLMDGALARMILSDIPYNLTIPGVVSGLGKVTHSNFRMASGEMGDPEFTRFMTTVFRLMAAASLDGSLHYIFMDWRSLALLLRAGKIVYSELKAIITWVKSAGGMGSLYRQQSEFVVVFKNGTASHVNNIELGRHGRNRTTVWQYAGMNSFQPDRAELLAAHPTCKPISLCADAILDCTKRGDIVLDPFVGSGTCILSAERTERICRAMELEPLYVDVALRRFRRETGIEPVHIASGKTLAEIESALGFNAMLEASHG